VQDSSSPAASNARILIDFNDTSPLATNSVVNVSLPYTGTYTFTSPGVYWVNFTVYNGVSTITRMMKIGINAPFNNYRFSACYALPTSTDPVSDTCMLNMSGGFYDVPKQSQLVLYVTWANPSKSSFSGSRHGLILLLLGGVFEAIDVLFKNGSGTVFVQSLTLSQVLNASQLVGTSTGLPLFRLVIDLESNIVLTVSEELWMRRTFHCCSFTPFRRAAILSPSTLAIHRSRAPIP
jgi:hypothetical protein